MERFIRQENIKLLRKALEAENDPHKRQVLEQLLAEQVEAPAGDSPVAGKTDKNKIH